MSSTDNYTSSSDTEMSAAVHLYVFVQSSPNPISIGRTCLLNSISRLGDKIAKERGGPRAFNRVDAVVWRRDWVDLNF